jgi:hypothetical protein
VPFRQRKHSRGFEKEPTALTACPICQSQAEEIDRSFDGTAFRCKNHGDFEVSDSALQDKAGADAAQWDSALHKAKIRAWAGTRPRILTYDF